MKVMRCASWLMMALAIAIAYIPFAPLMPVDGLDPSWGLGMNELAAQGRLFGSEVIFTFGPHADVYTTYYHPALVGSLFGISTLIALTVGISLWTVLAERGFAWVLLIAMAWVLLSSRDALLMLAPFLYALATLKSSNSDKPFHPSIYLLLLAMGIMPTVKGSMLVLCAGLTVVISVHCLTRHRVRDAFVSALLPLLGFALCWTMASQPLSAIPQYVHAMAQMVSGYENAMSGSDPRTLPNHTLAWVVLGSGALLFFNIKANAGQHRHYSAAQNIVLAALLFVGFKSAFVREDWGHLIIAIELLLSCTLLLAALHGNARILLVALLPMVAYISAASTTPGQGRLAWTGGAQTRITGSLKGMQDRFMQVSLLSAYSKAWGDIRMQNPLPPIKGSIDVYSFRQAAILANGLDWRPRPVLQSYAAYTPELLQINAHHLVGAKSPDNLLFNVEPIDGRLPSSEDGPSWLEVLKLYQPTSMGPTGVLLARRSVPQDLVVEKKYLLRSKLGDDIKVPEGQFVSMSARITPTMLGKLTGALYRTRPLMLSTTMVDGNSVDQRLVPGMATEGLLLSPLIQTNDELVMLFGARDLMMDRQVRSITFHQGAGKGQHWQQDIDIEFRVLSMRTHSMVENLLNMVPVSKLDSSTLAKASLVDCALNIDRVNGVPVRASQNTSSRVVRIDGWMAERADVQHAPSASVLLLEDEAGNHWFSQTMRLQRPDVSAHFKNSHMLNSGWSTVLDAKQIRGANKIRVGYWRGSELNICRTKSVTPTIVAKFPSAPTP